MVNQKDIDRIITSIKAPLTEAVKEQIIETVNGKIDALDAKISKLDAKIDDQDKKDKPLRAVYRTTFNIGKFAKWFSGILIAIAFIWTFIQRII